MNAIVFWVFVTAVFVVVVTHVMAALAHWKLLKLNLQKMQRIVDRDSDRNDRGRSSVNNGD